MRGDGSSPSLLHFHCTSATSQQAEMKAPRNPMLSVIYVLPGQFVQGGDLGGTSGIHPVLKVQICRKFSTQLPTDRAQRAAAVLGIGLCPCCPKKPGPGPLATPGFSALVSPLLGTNTALCPKSNAVRWRVPVWHSSQGCSISILQFNRP